MKRKAKSNISIKAWQSMRGSMAPATAAKYDKVPVYQGFIARFPRAIKEVALVSKFGAQKHNVPLMDMSFLDLPDAELLYLDAKARHMVNECITGKIDAGFGLLHAAHEAWDAMARLEIMLHERDG